MEVHPTRPDHQEFTCLNPLQQGVAVKVIRKELLPIRVLTCEYVDTQILKIVSVDLDLGLLKTGQCIHGDDIEEGTTIEYINNNSHDGSVLLYLNKKIKSRSVPVDASSMLAAAINADKRYEEGRRLLITIDTQETDAESVHRCCPTCEHCQDIWHDAVADRACIAQPYKQSLGLRGGRTVAGLIRSVRIGDRLHGPND